MPHTPTIGRIVHYTLTQQDADQIIETRAVSRREGQRLSTLAIKRGNAVEQGDVFPMMIVRNWESDHGYVNGQVFLDGNDSLWVTSAKEGIEPGEWSRPVIERAEVRGVSVVDSAEFGSITVERQE